MASNLPFCSDLKRIGPLVGKHKNAQVNICGMNTIVWNLCWPKASRLTVIFPAKMDWLRINRGFPGGSDGKNLPAVQETWVWSLGWEDPLEKGMATYSSILPWRIPWPEEPGRLHSPWGGRVGHNWATNTHTGTHTGNQQKKNNQQKIAIQGLQLWQGPHTTRAGELLERGEEEVGRAVVNKEPWLFIGLCCDSLPLAERESLFFLWVSAVLPGPETAPCGQHVVTILHWVRVVAVLVTSWANGFGVRRHRIWAPALPHVSDSIGHSGGNVS